MSDSVREFTFQAGPVAYYINSSKCSAGVGKGKKKRYWLSVVRKIDDGHASKKVPVGGAVLRHAISIPLEEVKEYLDGVMAQIAVSNPGSVRMAVYDA